MERTMDEENSLDAARACSVRRQQQHSRASVHYSFSIELAAQSTLARMRGTTKFAPKLAPISENLTVSMAAAKKKTRSDRVEKPSLLNYKRPLKEVPNSSRQSEASQQGALFKPTVRIEPSRKENSVAVVSHNATPVALEPIRQRADTAVVSPPSTELSSPGSAENKYDRSPLHNAVRKGDVALVMELLAKQPELLRKCDNRGNHPLHYAANAHVKNADEIIYSLLKAGAFVNATNERHQTPLLIHVISNKSDDDLIVRILLHHNAKPRIKVTDSILLPQYAASRGLHKVAEALNEYM